MGRPRGEPTATLTVRVPVEVANRVSEVVERLGVTRNAWLSAVVRTALEAAERSSDNDGV